MTPPWLPMMTCSCSSESRPVRQSAVSLLPFISPMPFLPLPALDCCANAATEMRLPLPSLDTKKSMGPLASPSSSPSSSASSSPAEALCRPRDCTTLAGTTAIPATFAGSASDVSSSSDVSSRPSGLNAIALTPAAARPCARTESASKWMTLPSMPPMMMPSPFLTMLTCFSLSPFLSPSAFLPLFRMLTNSLAHVFLIKPRAVTKHKLVSPSLPGSSVVSTGSMAVMDSPSDSLSTLVNGVPNALVDAWGMLYARTAWTLPRSVKKRTVSMPLQCVTLVTSSPPRILPMFRPRVARPCLENTAGSMRLMYPRLVMMTSAGELSISSVTFIFLACTWASLMARSASVMSPRGMSTPSSSVGWNDAASAMDVSISVRRSMPNVSRSSFASLATVAMTRVRSPSSPVRSFTLAVRSASSALSLSCSRPVRRRRGMASTASACFSLSQKGFSWSAACASGPSFAALMVATTASGAACTARYPSTTWSLLDAFWSSCLALRSMDSHLNARNSLMMSISDRILGSRPTRPTRLTLTRVCSLVLA
mmetsp:Transcript_5314/g.23939  ORF Transcript_5314/g.23939 Transcript_5314/m.23939 type:complete len:539 (-) Transcript_5314:1344-2960(-)